MPQKMDGVQILMVKTTGGRWSETETESVLRINVLEIMAIKFCTTKFMSEYTKYSYLYHIR